MQKQDYAGARQNAIKKLEELPTNLHYHNINHTMDVLKRVEILSCLENIPEEEKSLLKSAALYHDTGYLFGYNGHEEMGARIAGNTLPLYNYDEKETKEICEMILATQMPQLPKTKLQQILCDADLDNLGRKDFFLNGELLRQELAEQGVQIPLRNWYENSLKLLEGHTYFTESARETRQEGQIQNIQEIKTLLGIKD